MPKFVCKSCGQAFDSKKGLKDHIEEEHGGRKLIDESKSTSFDWDLSKLFSHIKSFFKNKKKSYALLAILGAFIYLGSTLFSSIVGFGGSTEGYNSSADTNPPTGLGLQRQPSAELPDQISSQPLSAKTQLAVLLRGGEGDQPGIMLQYKCGNCNSLVRNLTQLTHDFEPWVYLAPYPEMEDKIVLSAWYNLGNSLKRMETYNRTEIKEFICDNLNDMPVPCSF